MLRIESFGAEITEELLPMLVSSPFKPYYAYRTFCGDEAILKHTLGSVERSIGSSGTRAYVAYSGPSVCGFLVWSSSALETLQFGFGAAKIDFLFAVGDYSAQRATKVRLLKHMLTAGSREQRQHFYIRVDSADTSSLHALQSMGFLVVDGLITYGRDLRKRGWEVTKYPEYDIRRAQGSDMESLRLLASSSFSLDRLHADPTIPKSVSDRMHALWVENSVLGGKDQVYVAVDQYGLLAYSVFKTISSTMTPFQTPLGSWVIAAVAKRSRVTGVARQLCFTMLDWFNDQRVEIVESGTQLANIPSARLHESCGFRVVSTSMSLSKYVEV